MVMRRRWQDLSRSTRVLVVLGGAAEGVAKVVALVDLARRPADEVRGRKALWAIGIVLVNAFGAAPLAYLRYGRRRPGRVGS